MESSEAVNFPRDLLRWASHREGGVRRAFAHEGGRPVGSVISTPVVERLNRWICDAADGRTQIRAVILVGGPGNGKTDAVEQAVGALGRHVGAEGELLGRFAEQISTGPGTPRVLSAPIDDLVGSGRARRLKVVQDASVPRDNGDSPERALAAELDSVSSNDGDLYVCCLNRGILADAVAQFRSVDGPASALSKLLNTVSAAVAQGAVPRACWPVSEGHWLAVWPMDAESLVDGDDSAAEKIFERALSAEDWSGCDSCEAKAVCPFRSNREALGGGGRQLQHLLGILRRYEVVSGKRWTFRDLLSLVPELLVGNEADFGDGSGTSDPCTWVRKRVVAIESTAPSRRGEGLRARLELIDRLYQQAVFPAWPSLRQHRKDVLDATNPKVGGSTSPDALAVRTVFNWLSRRGRGDETQVRRLLRRSLTPSLDPALADPDIRLTQGARVRDIDTAFSRSVDEGVKRLGPLQDLSKTDRLALRLLRDADSALEPEHVSHRRLGKARSTQRVLRQLACRLAKRSVLARRGVTRDHHLFTKYLTASIDSLELNRVRRTFAELLNQGTHFRAPLVQSLGQPRRDPRRDAILVAPKVSTRCLSVQQLDRDGRAPTATPFLLVKEVAGEHAIALTFQLFKALSLLQRGAYRGCLPPDVTALIQGVESRVAGRLVRDRETLLDDDVYIELLGGELRIELIDPTVFEIVRRGRR